MLHQVPIGVHVLIAERLHCLGSALPARRVWAPHVSAGRTDSSVASRRLRKLSRVANFFWRFSFLFPLRPFQAVETRKNLFPAWWIRRRDFRFNS